MRDPSERPTRELLDETTQTVSSSWRGRSGARGVAPRRCACGDAGNPGRVNSDSGVVDRQGDTPAGGGSRAQLPGSGRSVAGYADTMGANRWPVDVCGNILANIDDCHAATSKVARSRDGGVVVGIDGTVLEQMVRFRNVDGDSLPSEVSLADIAYADWMGARHMSAYEQSLRPEVVATVTLSEETGRVTVFEAGEYETVPRSSLGEPWRATE
jgi:diadenylate cyclase